MPFATDPDESDHAFDPQDIDASGAGPLKRDLVAGLEKGLSVITAFDQERPRLTISEVATHTGLTRAAARRYLLTLSHLGFVTQDRKMFSLTPKVLRLGQSYMNSARLPRIIEPELFKLAQSVKEASAAGVLDGEHAICIAASNAGRTLSSALQPGIRVPAHCTGIGRVLLAALHPGDLDDWLAARVFKAETMHTIVDPARLRREIELVRERGYALIDQELENGLRSIAVPLKNYRGETVAAINLVVQNARLSLEQLIELGLGPLLNVQAHLRMLL
ncbi:MAG: helix-turn-helix domain-containing protein [Paucibacter sp.]|nr:helix-turn-helix domain-containing protein [Roseateles sp.]